MESGGVAEKRSLAFCEVKVRKGKKETCGGQKKKQNTKTWPPSCNSAPISLDGRRREGERSDELMRDKGGLWDGRGLKKKNVRERGAWCEVG